MPGVMAGLEAHRTFTKTEPGCGCLHGQRAQYTAYITVPVVKILPFDAYQCLKPHFVGSVLIHCVNHIIYFILA